MLSPKWSKQQDKAGEYTTILILHDKTEIVQKKYKNVDMRSERYIHTIRKNPHRGVRIYEAYVNRRGAVDVTKCKKIVTPCNTW